MNPLGFASAAPVMAGQSGDSQAELQQRILSILNAGSGGVATVPAAGVLGVPAPVPVPAPHHAGASGAAWSAGEVTSTGQPGLAHGQQMIGDGSKALDGLIQTGPNMMKHFPAGRNMGSPSHRPMQPANYYPNMSKRF